MLIITTETVPGREVTPLGLVKGSTIQSKHIGNDIGAGFKTIVGGEIEGYTEMITEARNIATQRMLNAANALGAAAVVGVRYGSSSIMDGAAEVLAYGTAVKVREREGDKG